MKQYHKNPRKITPVEFEKLKQNIIELGDISGIVHDINSDEIIGGNQRAKVIDIDKCEIILTEEFKKPDKWGTIATGYIIWEGVKMNYRRVKWTKEQCEKANITANTFGGEFDKDILYSMWKDVKGVEDWNIPIVFDMPQYIDNTLTEGIKTTNKHFHGTAKVFLSINLLQRPIEMPVEDAKAFLDKMALVRDKDEAVILKLFADIFPLIEGAVDEILCD